MLEGGQFMRRCGLVLLAFVAPIACSSDPGSPDDGAAADATPDAKPGSDGGTDGPAAVDDTGPDISVGTDVEDVTPSDDTPPVIDVGVEPVIDVYSGPDGIADARDASGPPPATLSALTANQAGRTGADLLFTLTGIDPGQTAFALNLQLQDAAGQPVTAFVDWAGVHTAERTVLFDNSSAAGLTTFTRNVTLPGFASAFPTIAAVVGSIVNKGGPSNSITATIVAQKAVATGVKCDPLQIVSRCAPGFACTGASPVCTKAALPQITKFSYFTDPAGPQVLAKGTDPADDISMIHIEFLSATNMPVSVDTTGGGDFKTSIDLAVPAGASKFGSFFSFMQAAQSFTTMVPKLAATPSGTDSGTGARILATLAALPLGMSGAVCDPLGFSGCVAGNACVVTPAVVDGGAPTSKCTPQATAMNAASASAPLLDPAVPDLIATGYTSSLPLWGEPPAACLPAGVQGYPQGVARLHLAQDVSSLTLTAGNPETNFPNALFLLRGVGSAATGAPLACNGASPSLLTLTNLTAGDYTIVINSRTIAGGEFRITLK